jgi:hypothetical protein
VAREEYGQRRGSLRGQRERVCGEDIGRDRGEEEILGTGQAYKVSCDNGKHTGTNDKRTTGKGNQVLVKVLLERGQTISARKVRKAVGVVYSDRALLPRKNMTVAVSKDDNEEMGTQPY